MILRGGEDMAATTAIKERLKDLNMSQSELAKALGTTRQNLANKFSRDNFTAKELCDIGDVLGFSLVLKADKEYIVKYDK